MSKQSKSETRVKAQATDERKICFSIMPFGGWFDRYYSDIYVPAIESAGLIAKRADDLYMPSAIINDIWDYTQRATIVLADLTGKNPNVFYELGLAHAIAKPVVLVTESISDVPFDLRSLRVIEYDKDAPDWGEILRGKIKKSILEILDAPLNSVLPTFLHVDKSKDDSGVSQYQKDMLEIKQEIDLLRRVAGNRNVQPYFGPQYTAKLDPDTAVKVIIAFLDSGFGEDVILEALKGQGVPTEWTRKKVKELNVPEEIKRLHDLLKDVE